MPYPLLYYILTHFFWKDFFNYSENVGFLNDEWRLASGDPHLKIKTKDVITNSRISASTNFEITGRNVELLHTFLVSASII